MNSSVGIGFESLDCTDRRGIPIQSQSDLGFVPVPRAITPAPEEDKYADVARQAEHRPGTSLAPYALPEALGENKNSVASAFTERSLTIDMVRATPRGATEPVYTQTRPYQQHGYRSTSVYNQAAMLGSSQPYDGEG